ncbi:SH3 and multiple ankyrin repeat domains protein 1-like [Ostrinia nubilalis]|uniref:SH3 and multiple ankyrin repeat domains protein 1-like n=1 Tax=Ostrinia nubilalis TaxID=29057 RepID=UPI0030824F1F
MLGGAGSPGGDDLLTVTIARDEHGYGMKVSGDNPVYVQSVKEHGAAWRSGLRAGDRILRVDGVPVHHHTHQQVVHMIRANPVTVLTVQQNASRHKTPITAPVPVNPEKQRQLEAAKARTVRLMLEQELKYIRDLRQELSKVPDVRKQAQLESAELRCSKLQREIDSIITGQPLEPGTPLGGRRAPPGFLSGLPRSLSNLTPQYQHIPLEPGTPLGGRRAPPGFLSGLPRSLSNLTPQYQHIPLEPGTPLGGRRAPPGFLSGLPRSLSNLTGQSLRHLRQARLNKTQEAPPLARQNSDDSPHNHTVPLVPTTCLDNVSPPPLPPRATDRRSTLSPPINPLAKPKPTSSKTPKRLPDKPFPMHQSMPPYQDQRLRSSHSLDGDLEGPQPNSIALQMSYPLVNVPPPPLQTDNRSSVPVLHVRSRSSPEQLDTEAPPMPRPCTAEEKESWERGTPPPGTPPPPYAHNTQPCADPQRAIISMEEDDSPASDNSTYSGLFSNLRSVRESKARTAVLLNWLLGERRCACASLLLILTDGYRGAAGVGTATLRRWAYEIQSTFLIPNAVLQLNGVDENMANEIEHVLVNEYDKEELLRNVFRKARLKAKEELSQQLTEFQVKRKVGLASLYSPDDPVIEKCDVDKAQVKRKVGLASLYSPDDPVIEKCDVDKAQVKRKVGLASLYSPDDPVIEKCDVDKAQVKRKVGLASLYSPDDPVIEKCDVDKAQVSIRTNLTAANGSSCLMAYEPNLGRARGSSDISSEVQVKRKVGLASLYSPDDPVIEKCDVDKAQEQVVVERLLCQRLSEAAGRESAPAPSSCCSAPGANAALLHALYAAALCLHCR